MVAEGRHGGTNYRIEGNPQVRIGVLHDLAAGVRPEKIARTYGLSPTGVRQFRDRNLRTIETIKEDIDNEFAALWIAEKVRRLAEYERNADLLRNEIEATADGQRRPGKADLDDIDDGGTVEASVAGDLAKLTRAQSLALRSAAEELGQLPNRVNVQLGDVRVQHIIEGVNLEDL